MQKFIFLSYSRRDAHIMKRIKQSFENAGLEVWIDGGIAPGTSSWKQAIENAIKSGIALVCILSPHASQSKWVREELDFAENHNKQIFIILASGNEQTSVPFGYSSHQWVDIRDISTYDVEVGKLTASIWDFIRSLESDVAHGVDCNKLLELLNKASALLTVLRQDRNKSVESELNAIRGTIVVSYAPCGNADFRAHVQSFSVSVKAGNFKQAQVSLGQAIVYLYKSQSKILNEPENLIVITFGLNLFDAFNKDLIPAEAPIGETTRQKVALYDWLENQLLEKTTRLTNSSFFYTEASSRSSETISVRLGFNGLNTNQFLVTFKSDLWKILEVDDFANIYPNYEL